MEDSLSWGAPSYGDSYEAGGYTYAFNGYEWLPVDSVYGEHSLFGTKKMRRRRTPEPEWRA
jgi:hypothetical protein